MNSYQALYAKGDTTSRVYSAYYVSSLLIFLGKIKRHDSPCAHSPSVAVTYFCLCFVLVVSTKLKPEWGGYYMPDTVC